MDIKVEGCGYVGVSENYAHGLVIASAFYATCRETVAQTVKFQWGNAKLFHQSHVVVAVCPGFYRNDIVAYHVVVVV